MMGARRYVDLLPLGARMSSPCHRRVCRGAGPRGSILILVLFMCLGVAVVIQGLCAVVLCAERAALDEAVGRARLEEKDLGLAVLRQLVLVGWAPMPWTVVCGTPSDSEGTGGVGESGQVEGMVQEFEDSGGWALQAMARQDESVSRLVTTALLERGRDGIDLPLAALVAETVGVSPGREMPWILAEAVMGAMGEENPEPELEALAYVVTTPEAPLLGEDCSFVDLSESWRLDPGWLKLDAGSDVEARGAFECAEGLVSVAPGPRVTLLVGQPGRTVKMPDHLDRADPSSPCLVVLTGGATLDARDLGDLCGVIVVDDGSVLLDGTVLHGAVFASEDVFLGETGQIVFCRDVLRWATDRSLSRARLVPGSRWEGME
jgi:hypothetical protein